MTKLIEFKNQKGEILRGLFDEAQNDKAIVFAHGFERTTVERKFKNLVDALVGKINLFRFDFSGCGLSDGEFSDLTADKLTSELETALTLLREKGVKEFYLVAHSFGGCVALKTAIKNADVKKLLFLAPAFNQKELMRFWFVVSQMKKEPVEIAWENFKEHLNEDAFAQDVARRERMTKEHLLLNDYFAQNEKIDFQELFAELGLDRKNILIVHGDKDDKVPPESNDKLPVEIEIIKVSGGDHDLQRPDMAEQYLDRTIEFLV